MTIYDYNGFKIKKFYGHLWMAYKGEVGSTVNLEWTKTMKESKRLVDGYNAFYGEDTSCTS
jgi:hypothetical protein